MWQLHCSKVALRRVEFQSLGRIGKQGIRLDAYSFGGKASPDWIVFASMVY